MDRFYRLKYPERNLQRIRRIANLSQRELAARSGVSVRTIQELEQGRKDINRAGIDTLRAAKLLNELAFRLEYGRTKQ